MSDDVILAVTEERKLLLLHVVVEEDKEEEEDFLSGEEKGRGERKEKRIFLRVKELGEDWDAFPLLTISCATDWTNRNVMYLAVKYILYKILGIREEREKMGYYVFDKVMDKILSIIKNIK